jgi:hypothetical protein
MCGWEYNITMNLDETDYEAKWTELAQDLIQYHTFVNMVMVHKTKELPDQMNNCQLIK